MKRSKDETLKRVPRNITEKGFDESGNEYHIPYELVSSLGEGGFAECYSVRVKGEQELFAIKVFEKTQLRNRNLEKIDNEIDIISSLHHQRVVRFFRRFESEDHIFMIIQLCQKGSLDNILIKRRFFTEPEVRCIMNQIVEVLIYLKKKQVIHRDIKLGNIFLDENYGVKIGDFGLSMFEENNIYQKQICGTPNYIAPEVIETKNYGYEADVWSSGVLMYYMLLGQAPFKGKETNETYRKILSDELEFEGVDKGIELSFYTKDFLRRILTKDIEDRITLESLINHPFLFAYPIPEKVEKAFESERPSEEYLQLYGIRHLEGKKEKKSSQPLNLSPMQERLSQSDSLKFAWQDYHIEAISQFQTEERSQIQSEQSNLFKDSSSEKDHEDSPSVNLNRQAQFQVSSAKQKSQHENMERKEKQVEEYFSKIMLKFRWNDLPPSLETRNSTKNKKESNKITKICRHLSRQKYGLGSEQILKIFRLEKDPFQRDHKSVVRVIYTYNLIKDNAFLYVTNHYLMGIFFHDESSIVYCTLKKSSFYIEKHGNNCTVTDIESQLPPHQCISRIHDKVEVFNANSDRITRMMEKDGKIKDKMSMNSSLAFALSFLTDHGLEGRVKWSKMLNGDLAFEFGEDQAMVVSTRMAEIHSFGKNGLYGRIKMSCPSRMSATQREQMLECGPLIEQIIEGTIQKNAQAEEREKQSEDEISARQPRQDKDRSEQLKISKTVGVQIRVINQSDD